MTPEPPARRHPERTPTDSDPITVSDSAGPTLPTYVPDLTSETVGGGRPHRNWSVTSRTRLWYSGVALLASSAVALSVSVVIPDGPARVIGGSVHQPGTRAWQVGLVLYLAAAACWLLIPFLFLFWDPKGERSLVTSMGIGCGGALLLVVGLVGLGGTSFWINGFDDYTVLDPPSPDGCVLVRKIGWKLHQIEMKPVGTTVIEPVTSARDNDGITYGNSYPDPIDEGDWSLTWHGRHGVLQLADQTFAVECT